MCELVKNEDTNAIDSLFVLLFDHYLILQLLQMNCFYSCSDLHRSPLRIFMLDQLCFQLALAVIICWIIAHILTITNFFPDDPSHPNYKARTDSKLSTITMASWIYMPYPGRWRRYITTTSTPVTGAAYYNV